MNEMIKRRKDEGFTLIELMIVIAVIGILAVVLVPKMAGIKTSAKAVGVTTNAKSVQVYLIANYDRWVNSDLEEDDIAAEITANFTTPTSNALRNPFSGLTTANIGDYKATTPADVDETDALFITNEAPPPTSDGHGTVYVNLLDFRTDGIDVTGYDDKGAIVAPTVNVK